MTRRKEDMGFFREWNDDNFPMEIDSFGQELDVGRRTVSLSEDTSFTRKHNDESLPMEIDLCEQELDISNRSFSLPDCSKNISDRCDQESRLCNGPLSLSFSPKFPHWSLHRSISYEQCYIKQGSGLRKSPYVSVHKVEQSLEYYSPANWKKKHVVETLTFNQESSFVPKHISNVEEKTKESSSSNSRDIIINNSIKWYAGLENITASVLFKFLFFIVIPLIVIYLGIVVFWSLTVESQKQLCEGHLDLVAIESALSENIFGQDLAVKSFLNSIKEIYIPNLNEAPDYSAMSVIIFLGSTGVGKSYMASIFTESYPKLWTLQQFNAQIDLMGKESTDTALEKVKRRLSYCGTNLVIIDDAYDFILSSSRTYGLDFVKKLFYASQNKGKKSLLILILNNSKEQNSQHLEMLGNRHTVNGLKQSVENLVDAQTYFVEFLPLREEHIVKCIKKSLAIKGIHVLDHEISQILEMNSAKFFPNGCKGIYKYVHQISFKENFEKRTF